MELVILRCLLFSIINFHGFVQASKLLLILMDGFRWDYFDFPDVSLPGFQQIFQEGVRAQYLISEFPTNSYPNFYSIMTGLYPESHGQVSNYMYDVPTGKKFLLGSNDDAMLPLWWEEAEPLWITAEKQASQNMIFMINERKNILTAISKALNIEHQIEHRRTHSKIENKRAYFYDWLGCQVTIRGTNITFCKPYTKVTYPGDLAITLNEGLHLFANNSADLVGLYLESPDAYGHRFGVVSENLKQGLRDIDDVMQAMMSNLTSMGLKEKVNVMMFSDHGMADRTSVVNLTTVIDPDDWIELLASMNIVRIWPKEDKLEKIVQDIQRANFSGVQVYRKEDLPERWHLKDHQRTPPLMVIGNKAQYLITSTRPKVHEYPTGPMVGMHGFDNTDTDMRAMFIATGPAFKKNKVAHPIYNIELYQMMCKILDITAQPHNGTWSNVKDMLDLDTSMATKRSTHDVILVMILGVTLHSMLTIFRIYF
ncbi:hypothetical protein FSP39_017474 [Pinctada imbricata]|uniref:glycerophosphocholine cholinephosphodiesterase n=1 Tax=Pinctada imbricata TaxID=66713 RepID=A0AA89CB06_PINIB|nr:hypothetical protein FSP39_017474 [Pinctada imbricata]